MAVHVNFHVRPEIDLCLQRIMRSLIADEGISLEDACPSLHGGKVPNSFHFVVVRHMCCPRDSSGHRRGLLVAVCTLVNGVNVSRPGTLNLSASVIIMRHIPLVVGRYGEDVEHVTRVS